MDHIENLQITLLAIPFVAFTLYLIDIVPHEWMKLLLGYWLVTVILFSIVYRIHREVKSQNASKSTRS